MSIPSTLECTISLPTLCKRGKKGNLYFFEVGAEDNQVIKRDYQAKLSKKGKIIVDDEKLERSTTITYFDPPKVGKRTAADRAETAARSQWKKKKDKGYSLTIPSEDAPTRFTNPMLAKTYPKDAKLPKRGCTQRKINGCRGFSLVNEEETEVTIYSRNQIIYSQFPHIQEELLEFHKQIKKKLPNIYGYDGELYIHGISYQKVESICGSRKHGHRHAEKCKFYMFDLVDDGSYTFEERMLAMAEIFATGEWNDGSLKFVSIDLYEDEEELIQNHMSYVLEGYEGTIIRDLDGKYEGNNYRSNALLKFKDVQDEEAEIIDGKEAKGDHEGCVVFQVRNSNDVEYWCTPACSIEESRKMFSELDKYIGRIVKVEYQEPYESGEPQFGRVIMEMEGKIIGGSSRKGKRYEGCVLFDVLAEDGKKYKMVPNGSIEEWKEMFDNIDDYVGQKCMVASKKAAGAGNVRAGRLLPRKGKGRVLGRRDRE